MKTNILIISPDFNISCGVSRHVFLLLNELKQNSNYNIFFLTNGGDNIDSIKKAGINFEIYRFAKDINKLTKFFSFFIFLLKFCRKNNIHIIHTHHRYPEFVAWVISKFYKAATLTTVHSIVEGYKHLSFHSSKIICVSEYVRNNLLQKFGVNSLKTKVLYNFVDDLNESNVYNADLLKKEFGLSGETKVILFIGRINKIKGIDILIEAFKKLSRKRKDTVLFLVGELFSSEIPAGILKVENVFMHSPTLEIEKYYNLCDVVVLPSRVESLGFGMLEAGIRGKAFVGSNIGGIAEFIDNETDGILVEPENSDELMEALERILSDKEFSGKMADNLRMKVKSKCGKKKYMDELIKIYEDIR